MEDKKKARQKAMKAWYNANADKYERINVHTYAGNKAKIQAAATAAGENISQYMINAAFERMAREGIDNGIGDNDDQ